jgi:hypothetical protein
MTPGLRIVRAWMAEDGTQSRLAEMINEELSRLTTALKTINAVYPHISGASTCICGGCVARRALSASDGKTVPINKCADCGKSTDALFACQCSARVCEWCRIDYHNNQPRSGCASHIARKLVDKVSGQ